jgi:hypothetical protein
LLGKAFDDVDLVRMDRQGVGVAYPKVAADTDNARRRNGTLDMQASLSSVMMTLSLTDLLADYPDAVIQAHRPRRAI